MTDPPCASPLYRDPWGPPTKKNQRVLGKGHVLQLSAQYSRQGLHSRIHEHPAIKDDTLAYTLPLHHEIVQLILIAPITLLWTFWHHQTTINYQCFAVEASTPEHGTQMCYQSSGKAC